MRGLANLDYGKKILITNSVKEEFKNIEIRERAQLKLHVTDGYPVVNKISRPG
jgi:rRNA-processing protein FCF1